MTDAERWRFLADHRLTLHADGGDYLVHWVRTGGPGEPPKFFPVSTGRTADEAIDRAIVEGHRSKAARKLARSLGLDPKHLPRKRTF